MYLNWIGLGLISFVVAYLTYQVWNNTSPPEFNPIRSGLLVAQDVGKTKQIQSKTGDASMVTELNRRRAIQTIGQFNDSSIKESTHQKGSTTGAIETFFLTAICPPILAILENIVYDAGDACEEFCEILNDTGRGPSYDSGGANNPTCNNPLPPIIDYDAGGAGDEYDEIIDNTGNGKRYDSGGAGNIRVCSD
jgi:hypothetical protein